MRSPSLGFAFPHDLRTLSPNRLGILCPQFWQTPFLNTQSFIFNQESRTHHHLQRMDWHP